MALPLSHFKIANRTQFIIGLHNFSSGYAILVLGRKQISGYAKLYFFITFFYTFVHIHLYIGDRGGNWETGEDFHIIKIESWPTKKKKSSYTFLLLFSIHLYIYTLMHRWQRWKLRNWRRFQNPHGSTTDPQKGAQTLNNDPLTYIIRG